MSRCLIALVLVSFSRRPPWPGGLKGLLGEPITGTSSPPTSGPSSSTYKHQRREELDRDAAFHREYWQPCDSTFREYIVNACNAN